VTCGGFKYGKGSLDNGYLDNFVNEFSNKYEKKIKNKKTLCICSSTMIQILYNFIII
jgi:hypothetical protein